MAATQQSNGTVFQAWLPHPLDKELRERAEAERRSISQTIRIAVEDRLRTTTSPTTGEARRRPELLRSTAAAPDASGDGRRR
ncbi:MAG: ribbon-helix-helix protein, CopG family [Solirubrobacterales bacterium]